MVSEIFITVKNFVCFSFLLHYAVEAIKPSMYSPPWKHCINRLHPEKYWQEFASPGFPHGITTQTQCSWIIVTNHPNIRLRLAFDTLNLTGSINNCYTQYVEFWEMNTATSVGKFCGDVRPGDYVSFGSGVRVDLKADTADVGHVGFMLKFKTTRDPGGYRQEYSFPKLPPGTVVKEPEEKTENKPRKPTKPPKIGGRINLNLLKRQRENAAKQLNKKNGDKSDNANSSKRKTRITSPPKQRFPAKKEKDELIILEKDKPVTFELWIIIVIGVGALLFVLFLCLLVWLCFCRKKKPPREMNSLPNSGMNLESTHGFSEVHTLRRGGLLPGYNHGLFPETQFPQPHLGYPYNQQEGQAFPVSNRRKSGVSRGQSFAYQNHQNHEVPQKITKFELLNQFKSPPVEKTSMYDQPIASAPQIILGLERSQSEKPKKKPVPTLKRKFSGWEKEQIRKGTLNR